MVVGDLTVVEYFLALLQWLALDTLHQREVLPQAIEYLRAFGIYVIGQEGGIHTRVSGELLLIERLYKLQREVGTEAVLVVALHLQAREIEQARGSLCAFLLLYVGYGEWQFAHRCQSRLTFLACAEPSFALLHHCGEGGIAIDGGEHPVGDGYEVLYLALAVDYECQCRCLHPAHAQHLAARAIAARVESGGVHSQQPVAYGTHETGFIESLIFALILERLESLAYGIFGQTVDPQPLHRARSLCLEHHPPLDELTLLAGITAVDYLGGLAHECLYGAELPFHPLVSLQFDAEAGRYHGQSSQAPWFPQGRIVGRFLEFTQVAKGPCHLVPIAFHVPVHLPVGSQDVGYIACDGGFLRNTYYHCKSFLVVCQATKVGIKIRTCGVGLFKKAIRREPHSAWPPSCSGGGA